MHAVEGGAYRSTESTCSALDYSITSKCLAPAMLFTGLVGSEPPLPHIAVRVHLHVSPKPYREQVVRKIKQCPLVHPKGCSPPPPDWRTE